MDLHARLLELELELPAVNPPVASYVPARRSGDNVYVSGQLPMFHGRLVAAGRVPSGVTLDEAKLAAGRCVLNGLAAADHLLGGDWSGFESVTRVGVYVASEPDFIEQHKIANGASDLLVEIFGERGKHARAAVGVASLPLDAAVEVELLIRVRNKP